MAAFLTEWLRTQLISSRCLTALSAIQFIFVFWICIFFYFRQTFWEVANTVDILTALSRDPIQWNAKSQLQCIFHCIAIHFTRVQAFPSDCNTFDQKCNPMCCIEFNLIQSERIKCDLYCVQRSLYDLPKCTSCVQEPIVLPCTSLAVHLFAEEIFF